MKKIVIPAILAAAIFVAGMFVYIPIEKASTVHNSIINKIVNVNEGDAVSNAAAKVTIVADSSLIKSGVVCLKSNDAGNDADADLELALDDDLGTVVDLLDSTTFEDAGGDCAQFTGFRVQVDQGNAGDTVTFVAMWSEENP